MNYREDGELEWGTPKDLVNGSAKRAKAAVAAAAMEKEFEPVGIEGCDRPTSVWKVSAYF